jgi:tetratricopeptide (TPR) repeat protein
VLRYLRAAGWGLAYPIRAAGRRPRLALIVLSLILFVAALAAGGYVWLQWQGAQTALEANRPEEARSRLAVCLLVWPRSPEVHRLAARAARLSGDLKGAEDHLNQCLKLQGGATELVQLEFLLLRVQAGEWEELAEPLIKNVQDGHPESALILETLGRASMRRLRYPSALSFFNGLIELRPDMARAYQFRGWVLERVNNPKGAAEDYRRALELEPDHFAVRLRVAEMLLEDNRAPEALPHLEQLQRQAPNHPEVLARLGMCRFAQGQTDEARRLMEAALVHLPNDAGLLTNLGRLDLQEGRLVQAEQRLRKAIDAHPGDTEPRYSLASALQRQGRDVEAAAALQEHKKYRALVERANKLLKDVADSPSATADDHAEVGSLLLKVRPDALGVYWLEQALERDPAHRAAHQTLADFWDSKGQSDKAARHRRWLREPDKKAASR